MIVHFQMEYLYLIYFVECLFSNVHTIHFCLIWMIQFHSNLEIMILFYTWLILSYQSSFLINNHWLCLYFYNQFIFTFFNFTLLCLLSFSKYIIWYFSINLIFLYNFSLFHHIIHIFIFYNIFYIQFIYKYHMIII